MFGQQNKLKELFNKYGWELVETQTPADWWIAEIWLIKSIWSPTGCCIYLSFRVDEQLEDTTKNKFNVWSIEMSLSQPLAWQDDVIKTESYNDYYAEVSIKRKWEKRIPEIFDELAKLRSKYNNLRN